MEALRSPCLRSYGLALQLGRIKGKDISRLDTGDILLHHREGKSIRDCAGQLVVVPRVDDDPVICPVTHLDAYMRDCAVHGIDVVNGYAFRTTLGGDHRGLSTGPMSSYAMTLRIRAHLPRKMEPESFTAHGARSGLAISLLMVGASDDEVKAHCRWATDRIFRHYTEILKIKSLRATAHRLRNATGVSGGDQPSLDSVAALFSWLSDSGRYRRAYC